MYFPVPLTPSTTGITSPAPPIPHPAGQPQPPQLRPARTAHPNPHPPRWPLLRSSTANLFHHQRHQHPADQRPSRFPTPNFRLKNAPKSDASSQKIRIPNPSNQVHISFITVRQCLKIDFIPVPFRFHSGSSTPQKRFHFANLGKCQGNLSAEFWQHTRGISGIESQVFFGRIPGEFWVPWGTRGRARPPAPPPSGGTGTVSAFPPLKTTPRERRKNAVNTLALTSFNPVPSPAARLWSRSPVGSPVRPSGRQRPPAGRSVFCQPVVSGGGAVRRGA